MVDVVGPKSLQAYRDGTMAPDLRREMEALLADGALALPEGASLAPAPQTGRRSGRGRTDTPEEMGLIDRAKDLITGDSRRTATTEDASDLTMSPEWNAVQQAGIAGVKPFQGERSVGQQIKEVALTGADAILGGIPSAVQRAGKMAASPQEQFQMILAANPDLKPEADEKGNRFFRSANGKVYSEQPGLRVTDVPRIAANALPFVATGGLATTVPRAIGAGMATQAALEAGQAAAGGDFSPVEIALAGGLNAIGPAVGAARTAIRGARPAVDAGVDAATEVVEGAAKAKGAPIDDVKLADIAKRAADDNPAAKQQLAELMAVDEGAVEAAQRLGIELPADVLSESEQIRSVFGGVRGKVGSEAGAAWERTVKEATEQAEDVIQQIDGAPSPAAVSDKVLDSMKGSRDALQKEAKVLYQDVDKVIRLDAPISVDNLAKVIGKATGNLGGDTSQLSAGEKMVSDIVKRGTQPLGTLKQPLPTVDALRRIKTDIQAAARQIGPFAGSDDRRLIQIERALKADELANAERIGGTDIRDKVQAAHRLTAQQKRLERRMVGAFGKEMEGSAAALIQGAIKDASKGNGARLTKLLQTVPEDLHGEVLMTALSSTSRAGQGAAGGSFGFSEFAKTYQGLRQKGNEQVYAKIAKSLGPDRERVLRDLYEISKRITDARAQVKQTGKANQPFMAALEAESLIQRVAGSSLGRAAAMGAGGAGGGGLGAIGANAMLNAIAKGNKDVVQKVGKLLISPEFQALAIEAATKPRVSQETVRKVARSKLWRDFAKAARIPRDPAAGEQWLMAALQAARQERRE